MTARVRSGCRAILKFYEEYECIATPAGPHPTQRLEETACLFWTAARALCLLMAAIVWLSPLGFNSEGGQQASVVPAAMDFKAQAPRMQTVQAYKQTQMSLEGWEPLMPTLFLPAAPKSATTWLYGCMSNTFGSDQLCPVNSTAEAPSSWKACDKRKHAT